jgi:hypothetical protein
MRTVQFGAGRAIWVAAWMWVLGLGTVTAWGAELRAAVPESLFVYAEQEETGDAGTVTNLVWAVGTNWFKLALVPNWRVRANDVGRRLELLESEGTAAILLRYDRREGAGADLDLAEVGSVRHPGFRLIREFELGSGCGPARVLDLVLVGEGERVSPSTAVRRVALVSTEDGLLECTLSTSWRWLEDLQQVMARLLVSVRRTEPPRL